ncbi:MAG TPA: hypothetical protein VE777_21140 [Gaiellales bacterium]|jgi:hypothetical protein|nr:hypothetical protein [Gaiellales bacterium]
MAVFLLGGGAAVVGLVVALLFASSARRYGAVLLLGLAEELDPIPIDAGVAHAWAALRLALRDQSTPMPLNDS